MTPAIHPREIALERGDAEKVALYIRADAASKMIERAIRLKEGLDGPELLLSIVAPGDELGLKTLERAQEMIEGASANGNPFGRARHKPKTRRACPVCGGSFLASDPRQVYCQKVCRRKSLKRRERAKRRGEYTGMTDEQWEQVRGYHCRKGHPTSKETVTLWKDSSPKGFKPVCLICRRERQKRYDVARKDDPKRKAQKDAYNKRRQAKRRALAAATGTSARPRTRSTSGAAGGRSRPRGAGAAGRRPRSAPESGNGSRRDRA